MEKCWTLNIGEHAFQTDAHRSFVGGKPRLPVHTDLPECQLCRQEQTFFLQVDFPEGHPWSGSSLAVFSCVSCADQDYLIPEMLTGELRGADIPKDFLSNYQKNFSFIVFDTSEGQLKADYQVKVLFKPIALAYSEVNVVDGSKIGGRPDWLLEDESPASYDGAHELVFLMQIEQDTRFEIVESAPRQMEIGLTGAPEPSRNDYYQLFLGNWIYLFGVNDRKLPLIYAITQI